jgi:hypothetical protein
MTYKKRVETLRVLVGGNQALAGSARLSAIYGEFNLLAGSRRNQSSSGWLLCVLHTTRALDTSLAELLKAKNWQVQSHSIGAYLTELQKRSVLTHSERSLYQAQVGDKRNKYMHEAGAMPQKLEADHILSHMHACLESVLRNCP